MGRFFSNLGECVRIKKGLFCCLICFSILAAILAVVSAIKLNGSVLPIDLSSILNLLLFYFAILLCCCKKFLCPLAYLFYFYYVYSQVMIFTSIILIYGMLNALILLLLLLLFMLAVFTLLILTILNLVELPSNCYFSACFNPRESCAIWLFLALILLTVFFCVIESILKSFVILLVF